MNEEFIDKALETVSMNAGSGEPGWKTELMAMRIGIVTKLLIYSYHALGLIPPADDILDARASIIAERADVSNRELKAAFGKALDAKMEKDLRTPITDGDITRAAKAIAEDNGTTFSGKWKKALPMLSDIELWDDSVKAFAKAHAMEEFNELVSIDRRLLIHG